MKKIFKEFWCKVVGHSWSYVVGAIDFDNKAITVAFGPCERCGKVKGVND